MSATLKKAALIALPSFLGPIVFWVVVCLIFGGSPQGIAVCLMSATIGGIVLSAVSVWNVLQGTSKLGIASTVLTVALIPLLALVFGRAAPDAQKEVRAPWQPAKKPAVVMSADMFVEQVWESVKISGGSRIMPDSPIAVSLNPSREVCKTSPFLILGMGPSHYTVTYTGSTSGLTPYSKLRFAGSMRGLSLLSAENNETFYIHAPYGQDDCVTLFWKGKDFPDQNLELTFLRKNPPPALMVSYRALAPSKAVRFSIPLRVDSSDDRRDCRVYIVATGGDDTPLNHSDGGLRVRFDTEPGPPEYREGFVWQGTTAALTKEPMLAFAHTFPNPATIYVAIVPK